MVMYTQFYINTRLRADTPDDVVDTLRYMVSDSDEEFELPSHHDLFLTERWENMLTGTSEFGYAHFGPHPYCSYLELNILSEFRNYSGEADLFIDWISPYVDLRPGERAFIGYSLYEEDEDPKLYYAERAAEVDREGTDVYLTRDDLVSILTCMAIARHEQEFPALQKRLAVDLSRFYPGGLIEGVEGE